MFFEFFSRFKVAICGRVLLEAEQSDQGHANSLFSYLHANFYFKLNTNLWPLENVSLLA